MCSTFLFAQNQNRKWYFGDHAGLDFNTSPPTILNNSASYSHFGCSTVGDASGNLLFYTDGMTVYDQTHSIMANGTGLGTVTNTNSLQYQYSLIVKQPGNTNIYFIFSNCNTGSLSGTYYSVVDMSLAAGIGSVTIKNTCVYLGIVSGQMTSIKHCNNSDVWVLTHEHGTANFRAYQVSASGVSVSPVISPVGLTGVTSSYIKGSPNGKKLVSVYNSSYLTLYDFDNATGVISNTLSLTSNPQAIFQSMEFSPDGTKLYCSSNPLGSHHICQWDLCAGSNTAIVASQYTIAATNLQYGMQLAPDGKIYVARLAQTSLGVINNPNAIGAACAYSNTGQSIAPGICRYGLPSFTNLPPASPQFSYSSMCQTVNYTNTAATATAINSCAMATPSLVSTFWNFGDPLTTTNNTSTAQNPLHVYSSTGTYTTTLILNYLCFSDTLKQIINVTAASPTFAVSGPTAICKGDLAIYTISTTNSYNYNWSNGANTSSIAVTPTNNVNYTVTAISPTTECQYSKVISLIVNKCTSIENVGLVLENISVYPNPASQLLTIESEDLYKRDGLTEINISNQLGQIIYTKTLNSTKEQIDISTWPKGVYLMQIKKGEQSATKKLVLE